MVDLLGEEPALIALDPVLARQLPLALIVALLALRDLPCNDLVARANRLAKGALPEPVRSVVLPLVRGALVSCLRLPPERRDYVAGLLPSVPAPFIVGEGLQLVGLAATPNGYDIALRSADGTLRIVPVVLPPHLVADVCDAVLALAARVAHTRSAAVVRSIIHELLAGRAQPVADAVAVALLAALCADAGTKPETKSALCGLDAVHALIERVSGHAS